MPSTQNGWKAVARQFGSRCNFQFHYCCGTVDGKHVAVKKPKKSGSLYNNYKGLLSVVRLALVDTNYSFMWCNVGVALEDITIEVPEPDPLPDDDRDFPYFIIGDDAFPLRNWLMKPYSRRSLTHNERVISIVHPGLVVL